MGRTKQTARKSTGGAAPRASLPSVGVGKGAGVSKEALLGAYGKGLGKGASVSEDLSRGKGGKGLGYGTASRGKGGKGLGKPVAVDDDDDADLSRGKGASLGKGMGKRAAADSDRSAPYSSAPVTSASSAAAIGSSALPGAVPPAPNADAVDTAEKTAELIASFNATSPKIDVVFAFDTTGSMYCYLEEVRKRIHESVSRLHRDIPEIRIGIIAVGDYCDQNSSYVVKHLDLTRDIDSLVRFITGVGRTSGGDAPEAYELALQVTRGLSWEAEPGNRALVVIGDSHPHPPSYTTQSIWWRDELQALVDMGIKVYGVQCNATVPTRYFYEEMAAVSGGGYLSLQATSCITDMFLAVCYRQVSESALEAYCADAEKSGEDIEAKRRLFGQLKSAAPVNSVKRCSAPWYDRAFDRGGPSYTVSDDQRWVPYLTPATPSTPPPRPAAPLSAEPSPVSRGPGRKRRATTTDV